MEIGVLIGRFAFSSLILRPFIGRALSEIPEKIFMIIGSLLFALTSITYILTPPFCPFLIVRVFQGIGYAFFHTASYTLSSLPFLHYDSLELLCLIYWGTMAIIGMRKDLKGAEADE